MISLYGMQGMGTAGTGVNSGGMAPGTPGGISPQLLALVQAMQRGGPGPAPSPAFQPPPGPLQASSADTPMANYIGATAGQQVRPAGIVPPAAGGAQPPGMDAGNGAAGTPGASPAMGGINPQMLQMLQALKGGQSGVLPTGQTPAAPNLGYGMNYPNGQTVPLAAADDVASAGAGAPASGLGALLAKLLGGGGY